MRENDLLRPVYLPWPDLHLVHGDVVRIPVPAPLAVLRGRLEDAAVQHQEVLLPAAAAALVARDGGDDGACT